MVKIGNVGEPQKGRTLQKTKRTMGGFAPSATKGSSGASESAPVEKSAATSVMSALLDLQSGPGGQTFAAAQRTLDLLDELQLTLLNGEANADDLAALARAASVRPRADADSGLLAVYDQISLRARVELAKLGH